MSKLRLSAILEEVVYFEFGPPQEGTDEEGNVFFYRDVSLQDWEHIEVASLRVHHLASSYVQ